MTVDEVKQANIGTFYIKVISTGLIYKVTGITDNGQIFVGKGRVYKPEEVELSQSSTSKKFRSYKAYIRSLVPPVWRKAIIRQRCYSLYIECLYRDITNCASSNYRKRDEHYSDFIFTEINKRFKDISTKYPNDLISSSYKTPYDIDYAAINNRIDKWKERKLI